MGQASKKRCTAIVLAAGSGSRMHSATAKQFMLLGGRPLLWYSLQAVEASAVIDDCILVTGQKDIPYVEREIVAKYGFRKVMAVVAGGRERSESVYCGLRRLAGGGPGMEGQDGYVFIHDGARPFLTEDILQATYHAVCLHRACVAAVPVKDTIKLSDERGFGAQTPDRSLLWAVQTPQVFEAALILQAYAMLFNQPGQGRPMTDDAMVVEELLGVRVKLVETSYRNIKITTPEDILVAESFLRSTGSDNFSANFFGNL